MDSSQYNSLVPDIFRHKTTRVRVVQPQVILLDFHGTISQRKWEDKVIFPYVRRAAGRFIRDNWETDLIQNCVPALRYESFEQRFRHKHDDAPTISDFHESEDQSSEGAVQPADQVADFVLWQLSTRRATKETQIIERSVWQDGFKKKQILTPLFDDVMPSVKKWHEQYNCHIYVVSSVDSETLKLLFENTDKGNLDSYISGYIGSQKAGEKLISELYRQFYERLQLKSRPPNDEPKSNSNRSTNNHGAKLGPASKSNDSNNNEPPSRHRSPPLSSQTSEPLGRPIMFITDSGPEAKAASQVNEGQVYECLLIQRSGNKRFRTYYMSRFQFIEKFDDIDFV